MKYPSGRLVIVATATLALILCTRPFEAAEQAGHFEYDIRALSELGGHSSRANGLNDGGIATGYSNLPSGRGRRAVVWWGNTQMIQLDPIGGTNSSIAWTGHNNSALIVGITQTNRPQGRSDGWSCSAFFPVDAATYTCVGFAWQAGRMQALPGIGGDNSFAASANGQRQVVGWAETAIADSTCLDPAERGFHAVRWDLAAGTTVELMPYANDTASAATVISDRGHVVGISGDCDQSVGRRSARYAVMWHNGTVRDLGNLGNDTWNTPTAITRRGDIVVGFANQPGASADAPRFGAWLWTERTDIPCSKSPGTNICDLGTLDVGGTAEAWGVNDLGQVVGMACSAAGYCRAFLWEQGTMKDLDLMKAGNYPHRLLNGQDINNRGQVSGRARIDATTFEAFVATPRKQN